jgi:hypothetical protein
MCVKSLFSEDCETGIGLQHVNSRVWRVAFFFASE